MCIVTALNAFQPKRKGTYVVDVKQDGATFEGSPFQIHVGEFEVCSAGKVKVIGAVKEGVANEWNDISINVGEAGTFRHSRADYPYRYLDAEIAWRIIRDWLAGPCRGRSANR